jgi:hypothetical protein
VTTVTPDDSEYHGKSKAGSLTGFLRRIERFEDVTQNFSFHPPAGVRNGQKTAFSGLGTDQGPATVFIKGDVSGLEDEFAAIRHCILRVYREVEYNMLDLGRIAIDGAQVISQTRFNMNRFRNRSTQ